MKEILHEARVAVPQEIETRISNILLQAPHVKDIYSLRIMQEGRYYHVDGLVWKSWMQKQMGLK